MDNYYCKVLYIVLLHLVKCRAPSAHCKTGKFCRDCACGQNRPALGGGHTPKKYVHLSLIIQFFFTLFLFFWSLYNDQPSGHFFLVLLYNDQPSGHFVFQLPLYLLLCFILFMDRRSMSFAFAVHLRLLR